jgi:hypothetical protein
MTNIKKQVALNGSDAMLAVMGPAIGSTVVLTRSSSKRRRIYSRPRQPSLVRDVLLTHEEQTCPFWLR